MRLHAKLIIDLKSVSLQCDLCTCGPPAHSVWYEKKSGDLTLPQARTHDADPIFELNCDSAAGHQADKHSTPRVKSTLTCLNLLKSHPDIMQPPPSGVRTLHAW